jgi:hypothetical protein
MANKHTPPHAWFTDPTFEEVLRQETLKRKNTERPKSVFICSAFGGLPENAEKAKQYVRFALLKNTAPFAPHLFYPTFLDEEHGRAFGLNCGKQWLVKADEVWVFGAPTSGMREEIARAIKTGKTIRRFNDTPPFKEKYEE